MRFSGVVCSAVYLVGVHHAHGSNQVMVVQRPNVNETWMRVVYLQDVTESQSCLPVSAAWNHVANCFLSSLSTGRAAVGDAIAASSIRLSSPSDAHHDMNSASTCSFLSCTLFRDKRCMQPIKLIWCSTATYMKDLASHAPAEQLHSVQLCINAFGMQSVPVNMHQQRTVLS